MVYPFLIPFSLFLSFSRSLSLSFSLFPSREHDHRGGMKRRTRQQQRRDKKRAFLSAATSGIQADTERRKKRTTARAAATITLPRFPFFVTQRDRAFGCIYKLVEIANPLPANPWTSFVDLQHPHTKIPELNACFLSIRNSISLFVSLNSRNISEREGTGYSSTKIFSKEYCRYCKFDPTSFIEYIRV